MPAFPKCCVVAFAALSLFGCAAEQQTSGPSRQPQEAARTSLPPEVAATPAQAQRLQRIITPILRNMDNQLPPERVRIHIWDDPDINAANAGGGEFYVTTGLLAKANDDHLRAIMAHEAAHADLGHVANQQTLGAGLAIGGALLEQIWPGSGTVTPIASHLISASYSRSEEREADAHGVAILRRAGYDGKALMAGALSWLQQTSGDSGGGFFATHPATGDRIQAVQALP